MCKAPRRLADGTEVACHECSQCRDSAVRRFEGRCIAESRTTIEGGGSCWFVTLTYGRDRVGEVLHERAVILTYSDVQKWLKLLRRHDYSVRYFITGEHGSENGRCHWHCLLFFEGKAPPLVGVDQFGKWTDNAREKRFNHYRLDKKGKIVMITDPETGEQRPAMWWQHGFSQWKRFVPEHARYAAKYVQKDILDPDAERALPHMSKAPPLGTAYFAKLAERYVAAKLAPQDLTYSWSDVVYNKGKRKGHPVQYRLKGRSAELFLEHYCAAWRAAYGDTPFPPSELVEAWDLYGLVGGYPEFAERERAAIERASGVHQWWAPERPSKKPFVMTDDWLEAVDMAIEDGLILERAEWERERVRREEREASDDGVKTRQSAIVRARENVESDRRARREQGQE